MTQSYFSLNGLFSLSDEVVAVLWESAVDLNSMYW